MSPEELMMFTHPGGMKGGMTDDERARDLEQVVAVAWLAPALGEYMLAGAAPGVRPRTD